MKFALCLAAAALPAVAAEEHTAAMEVQGMKTGTVAGEARVPAIDSAVPERTETATFALG